ncbi:MAG TPA: c-type cytochrome, partial [Pyrinomonadaceae bacterium]|nr:c-type cytochrome [Pyrinomonadaceae bacterium]
MKNTIKIAIIITAVAFGALVFVTRRPTAQTQPSLPQVVTAGQRFKNIKVLGDMPADQLGKVMNLFAQSLNVDCAFCHNTKDYSADEKKEKQTARRMIQMTFDINKNSFGGRTQVSCNTCHNGHEHPVSAPNLWPPAEAAELKQPDPKPTGDQILAKYQAAVGSREKLAKITSRYITASRIEPDGTTEPEVLWQKGKSLSIATTYPKNVVITEGYDGTSGWKASSLGSALHLQADDLAQITRFAQILFNPDLMSVYTKLDFRFADQIDGKPVYLVTATTADNQVDRLYFDSGTGLLIRRQSTVRTVLGPFVYQWDYSDYKDFGGVKIPTTIKFAQPGVRFTRKLTKV